MDATSKLFNKQPLAGMDGLKEYLLAERQDQFARAMTHKLTAYALGRHLTFADRADVEELTTQFRSRKIGFATWCIYLFKVAFLTPNNGLYEYTIY